MKQCKLNENHWYPDHLSYCPWCKIANEMGEDPFPSSIRSQASVGMQISVPPAGGQPPKPAVKKLGLSGQGTSPSGQKPTSFPKQTPPKKNNAARYKTFFVGIILCLLIFVGNALINGNNVISSGSQNTAQTSSPQNSDTYTNSIGMEFVKIPAGEFMMGAPLGEVSENYEEGPVHKVTLAKSYYLGKYEVTNKQWNSIISDLNYNDGDDLPVEGISWNKAQEFIKKLNQLESTDKYRLPSEAEWEYACRAGTTTRYSFGDDQSKINDYASRRAGPSSVGQKKPNPWGLYDMYGNAREWCQDKWHGNYDGAPSDGSAWESGNSSDRVIRGGDWGTGAIWCRSASREDISPDDGAGGWGFRVLSIIQKTDNTASYAKDEKTVEPEQSPVISLPGNIWYSISDDSSVYTAWGRILREPNSYYQNGLYISGKVFYKPVMDENPDSQPQGEGYDMNIEIKNSGGLPFIFNEAQVNINDGKIEYFASATTTKDTHKSNVIIENGGTQQFNIQSRAIELKMQSNYSEDNKLAMHFSLYHYDSGVSEPQNAVASFHAILPDYSTVKAGVWTPIEFTDFYSAQAAAYSKEESDLALIRTDKK